MIDPKIETTRAARNLEVKVFSRGGIEDSAMLTLKHSRMLYMERRAGDCLRGGYQERKMLPKPRAVPEAFRGHSREDPGGRNVYKEYTIGIFEVEFRINLIPNPTESRQKSYADKRRSDLEFQVGDRVLLKVSPWKGVIRFRKRGKLGPRYIGPFTVLARVGKVAYRLELPEVLGQIHDTFHVSQLRKCLADETAHVPLDDIQVDESLNYIERPVAVLERKVKKLRSKEIGIVKVQWQHRRGSEWTWEPEAEMRECYPELFSD
ncbi:hypothetical protein OSB04_001942 [Centaurea solstitialis]|uniref:Tf2-1-like SH3-like domain-containing protein n=1 Tax=Centaurea solstitialis TaxID=347529 RepID=A0AA38U2I3_9ASTR|nr:hypothetical protein OSB04_001942 [Centaurea solstitialis]